MISTIIFDFDGTIVNSFDSTIKSLKYISSKTKYKLSEDEIKSYLLYKDLKEIIKEFRVNIVQIPFILWKIRSDFKKNIKSIEIYPEIKEVIEELNSKYKLILLTSNNKKNVEYILKKENLNFFKEKYFKASLSNKSKFLSRILKKNKLSKEEVIYIGDEVRDFNACKKVNIKIISVSWGFNSKKLLQKNNPNYIVNSPKEILNIL